MAGEFGRHSLYKMLGYFSLVGLLRLHSLLGDFYQGLKVLENIDFNKKVRLNGIRDSFKTKVFGLNLLWILVLAATALSLRL